MIQKIDTENKNIRYYSDAIKNAENTDLLTFLKWFNGGENVDAIINSGYYDFFNSILKEKIYSYTKSNSKQLTALEIGCGGGRVMNAACKYFGKVVGIDIHESFTLLNDFLKNENSNFELFRITDNKIPIAENSVDFVYSFIVFQHILKIKTFEDYLSEIKRILKPNGLLIIYFGRPRFFSKKVSKFSIINKFSFLLDKIFYENFYLNIFKNGYYENYKVVVNHINLMVTKRKAKIIFKKNNLKIIEYGFSKSGNSFGTQHYFIATKC